MMDSQDFKYKIPVELGGDPQQIVGYVINEYGQLEVGVVTEYTNAAYIENVRLLFNGKYYNRCKSINDPNTLGQIVPIAQDFPFTSINWDFSEDTKYFYTNENLTVYLEGSNDYSTIEDLLAESSNPDSTIDTTQYKYRFPCIGLVIDDVITRLAINIKGVFYPYLQYDANLLHLYDHTLGEDEPFNKVGYYYSNEPLELRLTGLALDYYITDDFYLNPDYLNKQVEQYKDLHNQLNDQITSLSEQVQLNISQIIQYQNEITELEKLIEQLRQQQGTDVTPEYTDPANGELFIDIFRISPDGKYLEIDMTTGNGYKFNSVNIYNYTTKDKYYDVLAEIDQNDLIELRVGDSKQYRLLVRIDVDLLGGSSLYYGYIEVEKFEGNPEAVIYSKNQFQVATSDISNVYFYLLPGLVQLKNTCDPCDLEIPIEIQRAFLIMWAHIEAMRLERWAEAEMFYDLIKNNFQHCLSSFEVKSKSCNCHAQKQPNFNYSR